MPTYEWNVTFKLVGITNAKFILSQKVGCDWVVDSTTTEDQCGICGGTGETCTTIRGEFNKKLNITDGYYEITTIPKGSRHIRIDETTPSKNFISIGRANSNNTYLNGDRLIWMPGEYMIAGAMGLYEREEDQETIKIPGPVKHEITLNVSPRQRIFKEHFRRNGYVFRF